LRNQQAEEVANVGDLDRALIGGQTPDGTGTRVTNRQPFRGGVRALCEISKRRM
jgi:hypothetical protein